MFALKSFILSGFLVISTNAFTTPYPPKCTRSSIRGTSQHQMVFDTSSVMTAVEVFDGSTIVDPVVVSDVFWASLKGKVLALLIGNLLATIVFGYIASLLASTFSQVVGVVSKNVVDSVISPDSNAGEKKKTFIKATDIGSQPMPDFSKLLVCLAIDVIGSSSGIIPILGEATDVIYAPIAGAVLRSLYGSNILFALEFAEEILPFTDIIPLATICWVVDTYFGDSDLAKLLQVGQYSPAGWAKDAIDAPSQSSSSTNSVPKLDSTSNNEKY